VAFNVGVSCLCQFPLFESGYCFIDTAAIEKVYVNLCAVKCWKSFGPHITGNQGFSAGINYSACGLYSGTLR
jgi:hypothetical protein